MSQSWLCYESVHIRLRMHTRKRRRPNTPLPFSLRWIQFIVSHESNRIKSQNWIDKRSIKSDTNRDIFDTDNLKLVCLINGIPRKSLRVYCSMRDIKILLSGLRFARIDPSRKYIFPAKLLFWQCLSSYGWIIYRNQVDETLFFFWMFWIHLQ